MNVFQLTIVTPQGRLFDEEVESVVAPGREGYLGVLAGHAPMVAALRPGVLTIKSTEKTTLFAMGEGVLETSGSGASILADDALPAASLEEARARLAEMSSPWQAGSPS